MATLLEPDEPIHAVHIDGLAVLKIVKHCQESLPAQVTGSLLGLTVDNGILEITHAFPFPKGREDTSKTDKGDGPPNNENNDEASYLDGDRFQLEMMKMFREVNIDNNCIGWYKSVYLGSVFDSDPSADLLENHFDYQTSLSPNAVVIIYDPVQTAHGNLVLKCLRLTPSAINLLKARKNKFLDPKEIFEELPLTIKNPSLVKALLHNVSNGNYYSDVSNTHDVSNTEEGPPIYTVDTTFDRLDLSTNPYLEKHLEFLCSWVDDLAVEQSKFQYYMKGLYRGNADSRGRFDKRRGKEEKVNAQEAWASKEAPRRLNSLLVSSQIRAYCKQVDRFADGGFGKLFLVDGLHREDSSRK